MSNSSTKFSWGLRPDGDALAAKWYWKLQFAGVHKLALIYLVDQSQLIQQNVGDWPIPATLSENREEARLHFPWRSEPAPVTLAHPVSSGDAIHIAITIDLDAPNETLPPVDDMVPRSRPSLWMGLKAWLRKLLGGLR